MPELRKGLHFRSIDAAGPGSTGGGVEAVQFKEMNGCVPPATSRPNGPISKAVCRDGGRSHASFFRDRATRSNAHLV
jgi:hypothetical protein